VIDSTSQGAGFDDELAEALCACNHANCDNLSVVILNAITATRRSRGVTRLLGSDPTRRRTAG
jgi:hypothetical protein